MTEPKKDDEPGTGTPPEPQDVDLDLLADDALLREAIRDPTIVRLKTGDIIEVPHISDWPHLASRFATSALFDAWAESVLTGADFRAFQKAELRNYQVEKIIAAASAAGGITPGKRRPSSPSRRSTRKR